MIKYVFLGTQQEPQKEIISFVLLPFDEQYETERNLTWKTKYHKMRKEMLQECRKDSRLCRRYENDMFDFDEEK